MVFEMPRIWLGQELPPCNIVNGECVEKAYAQGKGLVF